MIKILYSQVELATEFVRCCNRYSNLDIAVAWCGNPKNALPFSYLGTISGSVRAIVGISFNQTHPDAIELLQKSTLAFRIVKDTAKLFHPKLYLFSDGDEFAVFIGSSNFTYGGFCANTEINVIFEGKRTELEKYGLRDLISKYEEWGSDDFSFTPNAKWLALYKKAYKATRKSERNARLTTPVIQDDSIPSSNWLATADWKTYCTKLKDGLNENERDLDGYFTVLEAAEKNLKTPWDISIFDSLDRRRILNGIGEFGWLGHVGAAGGTRHIFANGTRREKQQIVTAINAAASMKPINWVNLESHLGSLILLGPTIKVWGRLLCLVRPDAYFTVASDSARKNLSKTLGVSKSFFMTPGGYIRLLQLIHASPWFNSPLPKDVEEKKIWKRRVALLDGIFY